MSLASRALACLGPHAPETARCAPKSEAMTPPHCLFLLHRDRC